VPDSGCAMHQREAVARRVETKTGMERWEQRAHPISHTPETIGQSGPGLEWLEFDGNW